MAETSLRRPGVRSENREGQQQRQQQDEEDPALFAIEAGMRSLPLQDEDEALEGAKALAIKVKESCATAKKLT